MWENDKSPMHKLAWIFISPYTSKRRDHCLTDDSQLFLSTVIVTYKPSFCKNTFPEFHPLSADVVDKYAGNIPENNVTMEASSERHW